MLVYGDRETQEDAADIVAEVGSNLDRYETLGAGLERHQRLVTAFFRAAELVQSISDNAFRQMGADAASAQQNNGNALLLVLARAVHLSWSSGFAHLVPMEAIRRRLALFSPEGLVTTRQAEGYAFYALYPESYLEAAERSGLGPDTLVIGIRSIGAGLGAMVAAALGAGPAITVRPIGHPFDRKLALSEQLGRDLLAHGGPFAIVDEGPGLSGSSFRSVAAWLTEHGVDERRIHFFPSHAGDLGSAAQQTHRQSWSTSKRHVVDFGQLVGEGADPTHRLSNWIANLVGPLSCPLEDISGGAWRTKTAGHRECPADPAMERRKWVARSGEERWLVKFAGLGSSGESKVQLAHQLADAGFAPRPIAFLHGFLVMPWLENHAAPDQNVPRERLLDYLQLRASLPPRGSGASLAELFVMASFNIGQRFGENAGKLVQEALGDPGRFAAVPCCTDNRLHAWEWIRTQDGWFKLDGLDHHASHDLVGCQDIAWDIAGAAVEGGLTLSQRDDLARKLSGQIGRSIDPSFVAANEICYLGFQIGLWTMAQGRNNPTEAGRIETLLSRYGAHRALRDLGIAG